MKKCIIFMIIFILMISFNCSTANDLCTSELLKPIDQFGQILRKNKIDDMDIIIRDEKLNYQLIDFLNKNVVENYTYYFRSLKNNDGEYKVDLKVKILYKKRNKLGTVDATYPTYFIITYDPNTASYVIKKSNFFNDLNLAFKLGYLLIASSIFVFPFAIHTLKHKKKKWFLVIVIFNLVGVVFGKINLYVSAKQFCRFSPTSRYQ